MKILSTRLVRVVCLAIVPLTASAQLSREAQEAIKNATVGAKLQETMKKGDQRFSYYGKVLDQNDTPVEGARVEVSITYFSPVLRRLVVKDIYANTDAKGRFSVENVEAQALSIHGIEKPGYEYIWEQNKDVDIYEPLMLAANSSRRGPPSQANPTVFRLRKRGATTLLFEEKHGSIPFFATKARSQARVYDFIGRSAPWMSKLKDLHLEHFTYDVKFEGTFDESLTTCTVVLTPPEGGGILASERLLYEAPEEGYRDAVSFVARNGEPPKENCFYVKSRNPAIFSRIEVSDITVGSEYCNVSFNAVTNPSGERILDSASGVPAPVILGFREEVTKAFRKGRRPAPPDVPKLIQAHKEGKLEQALAKLRPKE